MKISEELWLGGWAAKRRTRDSRVVVGNFGSQRGTLRRPTHNIISCRFRVDPGQSSRGLIRWGRMKVGHHRHAANANVGVNSILGDGPATQTFPVPRASGFHITPICHRRFAGCRSRWLQYVSVNSPRPPRFPRCLPPITPKTDPQDVLLQPTGRH